MLKGEKVIFRPIEEEDLEQLRDWRNSPALLPYVREYKLLNMENQKKWFDSLTDDRSTIMFMICRNEIESIGVCGLTNINWKEKSAEVSIYVGQMEKHKHGYGSDALQLLLDYGFKTLNLHRIWGEIYGYNEANINLFEKAGFKKEGRLRDVHYWDGEYHDSLIYSILKSEYKG